MKYSGKFDQEGSCILKDSLDMNFKVLQEEDNGAIQKVYEVLIFCKPT